MGVIQFLLVIPPEPIRKALALQARSPAAALVVALPFRPVIRKPAQLAAPAASFLNGD
jgi:hypothetical protein